MRKALPSATITGDIGNRGDFEVKVNGVTIFSKQETGSFPDPDAVSSSECDCSCYTLLCMGVLLISKLHVLCSLDFRTPAFKDNLLSQGVVL